MLVIFSLLSNLRKIIKESKKLKRHILVIVIKQVKKHLVQKPIQHRIKQQQLKAFRA